MIVSGSRSKRNAPEAGTSKTVTTIVRSTLAAAPEEAFVRRVLLYVAGFAFFRRVVMFAVLLDRSILGSIGGGALIGFAAEASAFVAAAGRRHGRHAACHER
jgi:hypothetical protein